ncbi:DUF7059 domain-containing protein [Sinomonas susongensis]|uniref:DUF7059 domain-containing protein n=1 Tax=Sinomonas susongensis TaxID=1324851 RepID=UPI001FE9AB97|nr:methyltransferase [Sinomonas susongensis]
MGARPIDVPHSGNLVLLRRLAADLAGLGYTVDGVADLLGPAAHAALARDQIVPALVALERQSQNGAAARRGALATVVRFFLLGQSAGAEELEGAFPTLRAEGLLELGLAEEAVEEPREQAAPALRASVDLRPYAWDEGGGEFHLWVASDLAAHQRTGVLRKDHVLGIGQASATLIQSTARRPVERALDLGTGCGIQTFHLLRHARHVVATDVSERALAFTRFNLLLNAETLAIDPECLDERVELRLGSLLEPVAGDRFDMVVSNPPFVITPRLQGETAEDRFTYRDAGLAGDQLVADLVSGLADVLLEGGTAQMLGNWEVGEGAAWHDRVRSWVPAGLDAWVVQRELVGPEQYAETWLQDASEQRDLASYTRSYAAYLDDFSSRNVSGIGFGMLWFRRPSAAQARLDRYEELGHPLEQPIGPHWQATVERADWLEGLGPEGFSAAHLVVADDVTEERHQRPGAEHPGVILLRQGAGFRRTSLLSTEQAGFVSACDGDLSVGQIAGALGALLERDDEEFRRDLMLQVRELTLDGFLVKA